MDAAASPLIDPAPAPAVFPVAVICDTREQRPFDFTGLTARVRKQTVPLAVEVIPGTLASGDYSLEGFQDLVACERKSLPDLFNSIGQGRGRFQRELQRLSAMPYAAVVVEADWYAVTTDPPPHSKLRPQTVFRSVIAWQQLWPSVHWWFCSDRRFAEITTFRILERWWRVNAKVKPGEVNGRQ